jgi:crotonobetainyl-CoA:carnitine CoA-transferase CaiB-like acyl-CoA transferase
MPSGALSHVRVLELSRVLAGPWASQLLADLGAEVVKIERPGTGDESRGWGPPWLITPAGAETRESAYFACTNRGKKSVTVDLARPEGQAIIRRLAERSDVLLENFKVGSLSRLGLGWEELSALNPRLVYCSITGFGQSGPYRDRPGYDFVVQAMGGLMSVTGEPDGEPMKAGVAMTDILTGMYAATAVLAALAHRERSGEGQRVDLALLDVQVATLANLAENYLVTGRAPDRHGNAHASIVPYQTFVTLDGYVVVAVGNDAQFGRLCAVAGRPELATDPRFATNAARVENRTALVPVLQALLASRPTREWVGALEGADVPCSPINDLAQVFDDPQVRSRGLRVEVPHPLAGTVPVVASPMRLSRTPVHHGTPPLLGEHTREVLGDVLGMGEAEIESLRREKVI